MKIYKKDKFNLYWESGIKKQLKDGDIYTGYEWKLKSRFPFLFKVSVFYKLIDNFWIEQK